MRVHPSITPPGPRGHLAATVIDDYRRFDELAMDALWMLADARAATLPSDAEDVLKAALGDMPAYPDVRPGLERLRASGFTVATLTNSTQRSAERLVERAGLRPLFDRVLSADAVRRYKPAPEAYVYAARELGVEPNAIVLVAAHAWDIAGAMAAGCTAAFVARPRKALSPAQRPRAFSASSVEELAEHLVARYG